MKFSSSIASLAAAIAILYLYRKGLEEVHSHPPFIVFCTVLCLLIGTLTFVENKWKIDLSFDQILPILTNGPRDIGRMAPNAALCYLFIGFSILQLLASNRPSATNRAQAAAVIVGFISLFALIGYGYDVPSFYTISDFQPMSFLGAVSNFLFSIGFLFLHPERGVTRFLTNSSPGGIAARRLLPALLVLPIIGSFVFWGTKQGYYNEGFALSLVVVLSMGLFTVLISRTAMSLAEVDTLRYEAEQRLEDSKEELRELSTHVQTTQEEERLRIAREIHDELGQGLTGLKMEVSLLKTKAQNNPELISRINSAISMVDSTIKTVQRIATELRPGILDDLGLAAAIDWQAQEFEKRFGISCFVHIGPNNIIIDQERSTSLFRIFQEALTNVARHANATKVLIWLSQDSTRLRLSIRDNGTGMPSTEIKSKSLGLMGMRERALMWGGTFDIETERGVGTAITVIIPYSSNQINSEATQQESAILA